MEKIHFQGVFMAISNSSPTKGAFSFLKVILSAAQIMCKTFFPSKYPCI